MKVREVDKFNNIYYYKKRGVKICVVPDAEMNIMKITDFAPYAEAS